MIDLKYRRRLSSSVDKGLYAAIYNCSLDTKVPLSRLLDEAIEDFLIKRGLKYNKESPYKQERIKE